jgi:hypothetical protein
LKNLKRERGVRRPKSSRKDFHENFRNVGISKLVFGNQSIISRNVGLMAKKELNHSK